MNDFLLSKPALPAAYRNRRWFLAKHHFPSIVSTTTDCDQSHHEAPVSADGPRGSSELDSPGRAEPRQVEE